jgi:serine/threonine protein phosphatase PrpC
MNQHRRPDHGRGPTIDAAGTSEVGGRTDNQDRFSVTERLGAVSDGMGGYRGGERAAEHTIAAVQRGADSLGEAPWTEDAVGAIFVAANDRVRRERSIDRTVAQMGATLTLAALVSATVEESEWIVGHAGDSPAYLVTAERAVAVTLDHTVPAQLLDDGSITASEARVHPYRNMLLRAIGSDPSIHPDITRVRLGAGDRLVLVSDGISGVIEPDDLWTIAQRHEGASDLADELVAEAIARATTDNVTAVVLRHVAG